MTWCLLIGTGYPLLSMPAVPEYRNFPHPPTNHTAPCNFYALPLSKPALKVPELYRLCLACFTNRPFVIAFSRDARIRAECRDTTGVHT